MTYCIQRVGELVVSAGGGGGGTRDSLEHILQQKIKMVMLLLTFIANKTIIKIVKSIVSKLHIGYILGKYF